MLPLAAHVVQLTSPAAEAAGSFGPGVAAAPVIAAGSAEREHLPAGSSEGVVEELKSAAMARDFILVGKEAVQDGLGTALQQV